MSDTQIPASGSAIIEPVDNTKGFGIGAFGKVPIRKEEVIPVQEVVQAQTPKEEKSPAQDLKEIQNLLVMGIYPGNMAPAICKAHALLQHMVDKVELDAKHEAEFKARQAL